MAPLHVPEYHSLELTSGPAMIPNSEFEPCRVVVIGGCGHIGLPVSILSASKGHPTTIYDINRAAIAEVHAGRMPFHEEGAEALLREVLDDGSLSLAEHPKCVWDAEIIILIVGTPVDKYMSPRVETIFESLEACLPYMHAGQTLMLRSTVYPGVSEQVQDFLHARDLDVDVVFCPERVAQGFAIREMQTLPQIISGFSERGLEAARKFYRTMAPKLIELEPLEAELAKLFTNAYRYIEFATVNQFYMIAESQGASYSKIHAAIKEDYPRLSKLPGPGFAAGPCLLKDTMQLASFYKHHFSLGLDAVWVNEGLPAFMIDQIKAKYPLRELSVGILGMAFKANNDDKRDSLSYKLRNLLRLETQSVACHDPHIQDPTFDALDDVLEKSDLLIVGAPHREYLQLEIPDSTIVIDIWQALISEQASAAKAGSE